MKFPTSLLAMLALAFAFLAAPVLASGDEDDGIMRLALQISDNDPQKMNAVLNVAANVSRHYSDLGQEIEIEIVAFNAGLHMLRADTSPVADRIVNFAASMDNVKFDACMNTVAGMTKKEGKEPPLLEFANRVPAGVVTLMELDRAGWTIIRP
jgi:intracellular sulfur oxidation DsrE/DsrF family protein